MSAWRAPGAPHWRLARDIAGHDVKTARQMGWTAIKNGELLALVALVPKLLSVLDSPTPGVV